MNQISLPINFVTSKRHQNRCCALTLAHGPWAFWYQKLLKVIKFFLVRIKWFTWKITVALPIFRLKLARLSSTLVLKVSKRYFRSIWWLIRFDQLEDKVEKWLVVCQNIIISGPLPVNLQTKTVFRKFSITPNSFLWILVGVQSYFWGKIFIHFRPYRHLQILLAQSGTEAAQLLIKYIKIGFSFPYVSITITSSM